MLSIVRASEAGQQFEQWRSLLPAIDASPLTGAFGRAYYPAVFGEAKRDESFAVVEDDRPLLLVPATSGDGVFDYYGMPIRFFFVEGLSGKEVKATTSRAFDHLDDMMTRQDGKSFVIADNCSTNGTLSTQGECCLNRGAVAQVRLTAWADMDEGEAGLRRGLRKSYKSLLNWGKRNQTIRVVDAANPDRVLFGRYQNFHRIVAGRITRTQASWDTMYDWIASGKGELVLGFLEGDHMVAGSLVVDGCVSSCYASGVYDRNRFDKPMAHWPLWLAMLRSRERGRQAFELGDVWVEGMASDKEIAIGYFKRGFATRIATWIAWTLSSTEGAK